MPGDCVVEGYVANDVSQRVNMFGGARLLRLAYFPDAGNYSPVPTRGGKQDGYVSF